jgi:hypothetical protein
MNDQTLTKPYYILNTKRKMTVFKQNTLAMFYASMLVISATIFSGCSKDDPEPTTGKISGKVTALSSGSAISDATVIVFDANTTSPISTTKTNSSGDYTFDVSAGNYFLKFYKQGFESVPPREMEPVPFAVTVGQTTTQSAQMSATSVANAGYISGKVSTGSAAKPGVLIVAEANGSAYSAISDKDGNYTIFNVAAGSYAVTGLIAEFTSAVAYATVTANTETPGINVALTQGASAEVEGTFKVISQTTIATPPTTMDIALVHPITRETIPGLSQNVSYSSSLSYSFSGVPDGTYVVRATFANDYIVIDPDYITKFGDYTVTVSGGVANPTSVDIVSTSAVILTGPTNDMSTTVPVTATTTPTFEWSAYPSTSDYVIEVTDASTGNVIWGGFKNTDGTLTKNIVIPSNTTSIEFDSDGTATDALEVGKIYRWRVYASKNNNQNDTWNLISASEDQQGLIIIE